MDDHSSETESLVEPDAHGPSGDGTYVYCIIKSADERGFPSYVAVWEKPRTSKSGYP